MKKFLIMSIVVFATLSVSVTAISAQSAYEIPSWVKGVAGFWAEGKITDADFGEAISFLIEQKIIKVQMPNNNSELQSKISQLESKNTLLQNEVTSLKNENSQLKQQIPSLQKKVPETTSPTTTSSQKGFSGLVCKKDYSGYVQMTGKFTNGDRPYSFLTLTLAIIGEKGEVLDTGVAIISNIGAHETKAFSATSLYSGNFKTCEIQIDAGY